MAPATWALALLPLGLMAARNLAPWPLAVATRGFVAFCRSLHYVIVAILFVKAIGFGALAGVAALTIASMGFIAKLFAEAIEEISMKQVEAIRATGAGFGLLAGSMFNKTGIPAKRSIRPAGRASFAWFSPTPPRRRRGVARC